MKHVTLLSWSAVLLLAAVSCSLTETDVDVVSTDTTADAPKPPTEVAADATQKSESAEATEGGREAASPAPEVAAPFPPEGIDHLSMTVTLEVEIFGIGKDTIELKGTAVVHRSGPAADGKTMVGDLVGASLRGVSEVFGRVVATESPIQHSPCKYTYEGPGRFEGSFDIQGWVWLPEHNLMVFSSKPVPVSGTATGIPPVGQTGKTTVEEIPLFDFYKPADNSVGVLTRARAEIHDAVGIQSYLKIPGTTVPALAKPKASGK